MKYNLTSRLFTASAWMTSTNFLSSTDKPPQEHIPINVQAIYVAEGPLERPAGNTGGAWYCLWKKRIGSG